MRRGHFPQAPAVETSAGHRLAGGLVEFLQHPTVVGFGLSRAVGADNFSKLTMTRWRLSEHGAIKHNLFRFRCRTESWSDELKHRTQLRVSRTIEHETSYELVERFSMQAKGDDAIEAVARVKTLLRGVVRYDLLKSRILSIFGDTTTGRIAARRVTDALWLGLQIRANRVANDPAPWFLSELQRETEQLAAAIDDRHKQALHEVKLLENAVDIGLSSAVGAVAWAAGSLFTSGIAALGIAMMVGGGVALTRFGQRDDKAPRGRWSRLAGDFEMDPTPDLAEQSPNRPSRQAYLRRTRRRSPAS